MNKKLKIVNEQMVFKVIRWEPVTKGINEDRKKKKLVQGQSAEVLNISLSYLIQYTTYYVIYPQDHKSHLDPC